MKTVKGKFLALFVFIISICIIGGVFVTSTISGQKSDGVVINLAGKQRMLSQKMTKEALALSQGAEKNKEALTKTASLFDKTLNGLISGDKSLKLPATESSEIRNQLQNISGIWKEFYNNVQFVINNSSERNHALSYINSHNVELLKAMNGAVVQMESAGLEPKVINLAGRQRMLSQKISKEAILLAKGETTAKELKATADLFATTHKALFKGNGSMEAVKDSASVAELKDVDRLWKSFSKEINTVVNTSESLNPALAYLQANNVTLLKEMNKAVQMYETETRAKVERLIVIQIIVVAITVIVIILGWLFLVSPLVQLLTRLIDELQEGASQVSAASEEIASAGQELAEASSEQASSLDQVAHSLENISTKANDNAGNSTKTQEIASQAQNSAEIGDKSVTEMIGSMKEIGESSKKISKIIGVIEEIAFQTNLLALNAAVEAARAGEHGKGFAVVAEEVRNLAQRSSTAAKETAEFIQESVNRAESGLSRADEADKNLADIVQKVKDVTGMIGGIAGASQEQSDEIRQINSMIATIDAATQRTAATAEESASSSEELSAQAEVINGVVIQLANFVLGQKEGMAQQQSTGKPKFFLNA